MSTCPLRMRRLCRTGPGSRLSRAWPGGRRRGPAGPRPRARWWWTGPWRTVGVRGRCTWRRTLRPPCGCEGPGRLPRPSGWVGRLSSLCERFSDAWGRRGVRVGRVVELARDAGGGLGQLIEGGGRAEGVGVSEVAARGGMDAVVAVHVAVVLFQGKLRGGGIGHGGPPRGSGGGRRSGGRAAGRVGWCPPDRSLGVRRDSQLVARACRRPT